MKNIESLANEFKNCKEVIMAIGDENRLHIIIEMMQIGDCNGVRVGDITQRTHLSRPAVSHHLQILKNAGILNVHKEGTKNYYYFNESLEALKKLNKTLEHAISIANNLPKKDFDD